MEYTYVLNAFFAVICTSLALIFTSRRCKCIVVKVITLKTNCIVTH